MKSKYTSESIASYFDRHPESSVNKTQTNGKILCEISASRTSDGRVVYNIDVVGRKYLFSSLLSVVDFVTYNIL